MCLRGQSQLWRLSLFKYINYHTAIPKLLFLDHVRNVFSEKKTRANWESDCAGKGSLKRVFCCQCFINGYISHIIGCVSCTRHCKRGDCPKASLLLLFNCLFVFWVSNEEVKGCGPSMPLWWHQGLMGIKKLPGQLHWGSCARSVELKITRSSGLCCFVLTACEPQLMGDEFHQCSALATYRAPGSHALKRLNIIRNLVWTFCRLKTYER